MKKILLLAIMGMIAVSMQAQRVIDKLDRGVVAIKTTSGVFVSWRIQSDEYYDVTYNLYRDGSLVAGNLSVSNYTDAAGTTASSYTVEAVKRGVMLTASAAVKPWANSYLEIAPKHDASITSTLIPNDACCADVDGDGQVEILLKYDNLQEMASGFPKNGHNKEYTIFEVLKLDGTVLWWVNCGPNMGDFQNNEQNIVGYDWDMDGKAEVLMRLEEGSSIHMADGTTYTIGADGKNGTSWTNYREPKTGGTEWFTHYGKEFLVYCNGTSGVPYQVIDFPCARFESGESDLNRAWGDGYGHRSNKFFFGAPYLDGRKPSIFVGRGIYTRHKFVALDVDPATHKLTERWRWMNNQAGSPWYGQGYHNYAIVDVDWDGRDEIVWGSMVIDDNGKGLSTSGLGHGDAQHHGDFNPYVHGQEGFFCNESQPANNYRDLTTSKLYYRVAASADDGRSIAGNFLNTVPGAVGFSAHDTPPVSLVENKHLDVLNSTSGMAQNFRCYWDGDLQEETFNYSNGKNTAGAVYKPGSGTSWVMEGSMTNNDTKGTPCFMGDILGDWREEFIMRTANNCIRIYTTTIATPWRNYSLWYDHQYRNGMVWEMCGYNQPPHVSYFIGEMEGITAAPPSLTMEGRTEVANGGTISHDGEEVITCETNDMTINVTDGASPYLYIDNAPSWVQGSAPSEATSSSYKITYQYYNHTLQGGGFGGGTHVVKQGDGILTYPEKDMTYSGQTDVWAGTLNLNGSIANSPLWLNRLTYLNTPAKAVTIKSLVADYGAAITVGGDDAIGTLVATDSLKLGFGARLRIDAYSDGFKADQIQTAKLIIEKKNWKYGPEYKQPVIEFNCHFNAADGNLAAGKYPLGTVGTIDGDVASIKIEGVSKVKSSLLVEDGTLVLLIEGTRDPADIEWNATSSNIWDVATTENFVTHDPARASETFIEGDNVYFTDETENSLVRIADGVELRPANIYYTGSKSYTIGGSGKITEGTFYHYGTGQIAIQTNNTYTGGNHLAGGVTSVKSLSNSMQPYGNLGGVTTTGKFTIENGAVLQNTDAVTNGSPIKIVGRGVIKTLASFAQQAAISGDSLVKSGGGVLTISGNLIAARTIVESGSITYNGGSYSKVVELQGTSSISGTGFISSGLNIASGAKASVTTVNRQTTTSTLTGEGQVTIYCATEKGNSYYATRTPLQLKMSNFTGTLVAGATYTADGRFTFDTSNGSNKFTLNIPAGIIVQNSGKTLAIGKVTGTGTLGGFCAFSNGGSTGKNTWNVGNDENFTFDGVFTSADVFNKVGNGTMTISKAWENTGAVNVSKGTMVIGTGKTIGTGALTVANGATLQGLSATARATSKTHGFTNSSVSINGEMRFGSGGNATTGYWYLGKAPFNISATGKLYVGIAKCSTSPTVPGCTHYWSEESTSSITFRDGATVSVYLASTYDPAASIGADETKADSFYVFNFAKATVGNVKFELPELPEHYYWDTTLFKTGYLYIRYTGSTGIRPSFADADPCNVYDLRGRLVSRQATATSTDGLPAGVYIRGGRKVMVK